MYLWEMACVMKIVQSGPVRSWCEISALNRQRLAGALGCLCSMVDVRSKQAKNPLVSRFFRLILLSPALNLNQNEFSLLEWYRS